MKTMLPFNQSRPPVNVLLFHDLDLDPMTLTCKHDSQILKMYPQQK